MTTNYELRHVDYRSCLTLLKSEALLSTEEWASLHCKVQWDLERECHEIFRALSTKMLEYSQYNEEFVNIDPTDLTAMCESMQLTVFKYFSYIHAKLEKLVELRGYLKELKQLI